VPEEGVADIAGLTRPTVRLFYKKAAKRGEIGAADKAALLPVKVRLYQFPSSGI